MSDRLCQICGEGVQEEMCPDCGAKGCAECLDGHFCITGEFSGTPEERKP